MAKRSVCFDLPSAISHAGRLFQRPVSARQKFSFNENCIERLSTDVEVMRPAVGESKFWLGKPKPGWLNRLNASHRTSALLCPIRAKRFESEVSKLTCPGP